MPNNTGPFNLATTYLRLRSDLSIEPLAGADEFWSKLMGGVLGSFHNEYLVITSAFDADWPSWEMHPNGDEIVCLLEGKVTLILEIDGREHPSALGASGDYVRVPRGTWHTAKTSTPCRMLFITAGEGTQIRPA